MRSDPDCYGNNRVTGIACCCLNNSASFAHICEITVHVNNIEHYGPYGTPLSIACGFVEVSVGCSIGCLIKYS